MYGNLCGVEWLNAIALGSVMSCDDSQLSRVRVSAVPAPVRCYVLATSGSALLNFASLSALQPYYPWLISQ
jgi:hypothetical protein